MLLSAVLIGVVLWALSDSIQTFSLTHIFNSKLAERFSSQAERQRIMFDRYVKSHHQAVKLFSNSQNLNKYISSPNWGGESKKITHTTSPPWLPRLSVMRSILQPRYLLLLDANGQLKELYQANATKLPQELHTPNSTLLNLSQGQGYLTRLNKQPYLLASEKIIDSNGITKAILMLASPLDEEFLLASQASLLEGSSIIALLTENQPNIMVSSNNYLIPAGTSVEKLKNDYLKIGQGFFDYGATDMLIELVSFIPSNEATKLTNAVLNEVRPIRAIAATIFISAFMLYVFFMTKRLHQLTNHVANFSEKINLKKVLSSETRDELSILDENFNLLSKAITDETQELTHQALHDHLTGLPNRKLLHNRLEQEILRGKRTSKQFILLLGDLNHFKEVNDTLGHHIGDVILQQVAKRLSDIFRKTDTVARLGGDEFAVLLPETNFEQAKVLLQKVKKNFNRSFIVEDHTLHTTMSIGVTEYPTHGEDVNILIKRADVAMYVAKENKLGYATYDSKKDTHSIGRLALMSDLRIAIEKQQLQVYYQPTIDVSSEKIIGTEALVRWQHDRHGFIPPEEFIPLAEKTGLIRPLTYWILEEAIKQHVKWKKQNIHLTMSVNLSVHNLHDIKLLPHIDSLLSDHEMSHENLILEISESDIMTEHVAARKILNKIRATGIQLSIDDFGTGYSSLSYIKKLPINEIKIDKSFVLDMNDDQDDNTIVKATTQLAHNLGLKIVAEGVCDKDTWQQIKDIKCDIAQGYYISPPISANEFTAWMMKKNWENKKSTG